MRKGVDKHKKIVYNVGTKEREVNIMTNLIGKEAKIIAKDSWCYGEYGIIKHFDGEYYHIAVTGDDSMQCVFTRNEFKVRREKK